MPPKVFDNLFVRSYRSDSKNLNHSNRLIQNLRTSKFTGTLFKSYGYQNYCVNESIKLISNRGNLTF